MPIYIYSGEYDEIIPPENQEQQEEFYENYNANVNYVSEENGHAFSDTTFRDGLEHHYNTLVTDWEGLDDDEEDWLSAGTLIAIDQDEFTETGADDREASGFAERGWLYYPDNCVGDSASCKLVIIFTGGGGNQTETIGTGFIQTAAANDLVLLFPQQALEYNACFDLTAETGDDYDTLTGT